MNERTLDLLLTTEKELSMREKTAECRCNPKFLLFVSGVAHEHAYVVLLIMRPVNMHSESHVCQEVSPWYNCNGWLGVKHQLMCREVWENIYILSQTSQCFRSFEMQATCDGGFAWQHIFSAIFPFIPVCTGQCIHMSLQKLMPAHWHTSVWVTFHCFSASVAGDLPSRRRMVCWLWPWTQQGNKGRESSFFFFLCFF